MFHPQGASAVDPEVAAEAAPLTAPAAGGAPPPPPPVERQLSQLSLKGEREKPPRRPPPSTAGGAAGGPAAPSKAKLKVASFPHGSRVGKDGRKVHMASVIH